jgi:hypothetical protein
VMVFSYCYEAILPCMIREQLYAMCLIGVKTPTSRSWQKCQRNSLSKK